MDPTVQEYLGLCIVDDILGELNDDSDSPMGEYGEDIKTQIIDDSGNYVVEFTNTKDNKRYVITIKEKV